MSEHKECWDDTTCPVALCSSCGEPWPCEAEQEQDARRGRCYDLSAVYVVQNQRLASLRLCHGWPILRGDSADAGKRYGHAWVERTVVYQLPFENQVHEVKIVECWDTVTESWWPRVVYYQGGTIEESKVVKYSFAELQRMLLDTEDYGPWHESPYRDTLPFRNEVSRG